MKLSAAQAQALGIDSASGPRPKRAAHGKTPESAVLRACLKLLGLRRVLHWRSNNTGVYDPTRKLFRSFSGLRGVADILAVLPPQGRLLAIEAKAADGRQSKHQKAFQANVEAAGGIYAVVRSDRELERLLDEISLKTG